jgi:mRNA-degrading endonuclease toxin of MazEF toxin-antitoxin module
VGEAVSERRRQKLTKPSRNAGFEQDGTGRNFDRPVVVVRGFNEKIFLGVALTGHKKQGKFYFPIGSIEDREASVVLSQIRLIDTKRLIRKMGVLDKKVFQELKNALKRTLFD